MFRKIKTCTVHNYRFEARQLRKLFKKNCYLNLSLQICRFDIKIFFFVLNSHYCMQCTHVFKMHKQNRYHIEIKKLFFRFLKFSFIVIWCSKLELHLKTEDYYVIQKVKYSKNFNLKLNKKDTAGNNHYKTCCFTQFFISILNYINVQQGTVDLITHV